MIELAIDIDTRDASLFVRGVNLKAIPVAEVRALNKVIVTVRKEAGNEIHKVRRLKKGTIRKQLVIVRASKRNTEARVRGSRRPISLKEYAAKWSGRKGNRRVVVNVSGKRELLNHAFILGAQGGQGGGHVFERTTAAPLPIRKLWGPSIGSAIVKLSTRNAMRRVVGRQWPIVYKRELEFALRKLKRR